MCVPRTSLRSTRKVTSNWPSRFFSKEVIYAEDVEKIFGKRPWVSRSQELMEENDKLEAEKAKAAEPKLEDMPDEVKKAQAEHEAAEKQKQAENTDQHADTDKKGDAEQAD